MAQKKRKTGTKTRRTSFRQRRVAAIIATVLALGMLVGVLGPHIFRSARPGDDLDDLEQLREHYEQYREYYEQQVANLKEALDITDNPSPALLRDIAAYYRDLVEIQLFLQHFEDETALLERYRDELVKTYRDLLEMEPHDTGLRKDFLNIYYNLVDDPAAALEVALPLRDLLRENPQTGYYVEMIFIMNHLEQDEFVDEESAWLREYFEEMLTAGEMKNLDRYYYALFLSNILNEPDLAREQLILILDTEEEDSALYNQAKSYLEFMDANNEDE